MVVLAMLDSLIKLNNGVSPTFRELAIACDCKSVRTIVEHVHYLIRKGCIARTPLELRSLSVTEKGADYLKLAKPTTARIRVG